MIRAVIFDCFGVLTTDGWLPFRKTYFGDDSAKSAEAENLNRQCDAGFISTAEFTQAIAELAGVPTADVRTEIDSNVPNNELFTYIASHLRPQYKLGLLSNASGDWLSKLFTKQQTELFDATALSFEMGVTKPDMRAYQTIAGRLHVELAECLFIDDQQRFCDGARDAGMSAIWYQNNDQLVKELSAALAH